MGEKIKALRAAFPHTLPILTGYLALGAAYGVLLSTKGYGVVWALLTSTFIYAGSMQFVSVGHAGHGVPSSERLSDDPDGQCPPFFLRHCHAGQAGRYREAEAVFDFAMSDETFSLLCSSPPPEGVSRKWFLFFTALLDHSYWIAGSVAGRSFGRLGEFNTAGIDFVLTAMFVVIFINQWEATSNHLPVLIGLGAALLCRIVLGPEKFLIPAMIVILVLVTLLRGPIEKRGDL